MPTYDYEYTGCGVQVETRHAIGVAPPRCRKCGGGLRRVLLQAPAMPAVSRQHAGSGQTRKRRL
jgi:putative FmdB family regulatory protein